MIYPLTSLPDKDAAILCELVYENKVLKYIFSEPTLKDLSLADSLFDKKTIRKEILSRLSKDNNGNINMPLDDYADY